MPIINVKCKQCGSEFSIQRWEKKRRKFCSRECYEKSIVGHKSYKPDPKEERACVACGKKFFVGGRGRPDKRTRLCSWECQRASRYRQGRKANELSATDAAYIAGFVDGEGCISLIGRDGTNSAYVRLTIANSDRPVLEWIKTITGIGDVNVKGRGTDKHKIGYYLRCAGDGTHTLLKQLRPYLKIKTAQADLAIATHERLMNPALKSDRSWQQEWKEKMHTLNRRGPGGGV